MKARFTVVFLSLVWVQVPAAQAEIDLSDLDTVVIAPDSELGKQLPQMVGADMRARRAAVNSREVEAWRAIRTREDWEKFRDPRIQALRASLGEFPAVPNDLQVRVTRTLKGEGYRIENLVFVSRPGLVVTANLYLPADPPASMPGIVIIHSHHNPKTQGELQDMGLTWARLGCAVLVMDQLGHGERRSHPFVNASSYAGKFGVTRQDYYFRFNTAMQLHLIGDSLIGWMVWDVMRGVDLLLSRPGVDRKRIILLGSVAGGGDPAAVAAALDPRIAAVVPFNFGGPQPETTFPLPADAELRFNYLGGGSWESTRNLRLSGRDGFPPWLIVGAAAPRRLIYAHEFAWDSQRDPVWKRLQKLYELYGEPDNLAEVHGRGAVTGMPPEATHCNNIGAVHRKPMYPALKRWFGIPEPEKEYQQRHPAEDLMCLTPEVAAALKARPLHELAGEIGAQRAAAARQELSSLSAAEQRQKLRQDWAALLGPVEVRGEAKVMAASSIRFFDASVKLLNLEVEPGIFVPTILMLPPKQEKPPVVVAFAQEGKDLFLKQRTDSIWHLLDGGAAVCLPDLRGTGETRIAGDSRNRNNSGTSLSASEQMLGQTLLGDRLRDLRSVLKYLRSRSDVDGSRVALWGDSSAPSNREIPDLNVPLDAEKMPYPAEPMGALLALLGSLYEDSVRASYAWGGLVDYQTVFEGQFIYLPHDAVIPGAMAVGDLSAVAAALFPLPVRQDGLRDERNRPVPSERVARAYASARRAYEKAPDRLVVNLNEAGWEEWLLTNLKTPAAGR